MDVLPTQETLPVNLMSQSGYIIFLHKSTQQTLEVTGDRSLTSNIRKTGFSKTFPCSASGSTCKDNPEMTVVARDHTASQQFLPYQTSKARTGGRSRHAGGRWMADPQRCSTEQVTQARSSSTRTLFKNEAKKLMCRNKTKHRSAGSMKVVF